MIVECNLIEIEIYALGAGVDDCVRRGDMAFMSREVPIRVIVHQTFGVVNHAH
jgi:hypothetical protein